MSLVIEIILHDDEEPPWAEYDVFRDGGDRIAAGTAPSVFAAIDAVVRALENSSLTATIARANAAEPPDSGKPSSY